MCLFLRKKQLKDPLLVCLYFSLSYWLTTIVGSIIVANRKFLKKDIRQRFTDENIRVFKVDRFKRSNQNVEGQMMDVQAIHTTGLLPEKEIFVVGLNRVFAQTYFLIHK